MLRKIDFKEFKKLYKNHILKDFPQNERPSFWGFKKRILKQDENVYIYEDNSKEKAYIIFKELEGYIFISFFAVYEEYRGEGIGTKTIKELEQNLKNKKGIVIEVENPKYAKNEEEEKLQKRRIKFYERLGFKLVEKLEVSLIAEYKIMIKGNEEINAKKTKELMEKYYHSFLNPKIEKILKFRIEE